MAGNGPVKAAVASSDGTRLDLHFGEIEEVYVYALGEDGEVTPEGKRAFPDADSFDAPAGGCHAKNEEFIKAVRGVLWDCQYLLVRRIGDIPSRLLLRYGIEVLEQEGEILKLLPTLAKYAYRGGARPGDAADGGLAREPRLGGCGK